MIKYIGVAQQQRPSHAFCFVAPFIALAQAIITYAYADKVKAAAPARAYN